MNITAKKNLGALLAISMLLSALLIFSIPTYAVDGDWNVLGTATEYDEDFDGVPVSRPGYEYTDEGLHMIPAKWEGHQTPFGTFQTKNKVNLKEGVYMLVRVDNFTYSGEKWFNFSIWDSVGVAPGSTEHGEGAQCHIRPNDQKNVGGVDWYIEGFKKVGNTTDSVISKDTVSHDEQGRVVLALTIEWDGTSYSVNVNGASATEGVITYMNERWGGTDSEAYISFSLQNSNKNGTVEATVLKYGTSEATATVPQGDDRRDPEEFNHTPVDIMDSSAIAAGQPAVFMNGNTLYSDIVSKPISLVGANLTVKDDYSVNVSVNKEKADAGEWTVKYDVSYSIEDFPVCAILTRNFCTCRDEVCYANEVCNLYICTGEAIQPAPENLVEYLDHSQPITIGNDTYLLFYFDTSDEYAPFEAAGRINSARVDFMDIDYQTPGSNEFDVCFIAFFRNVDEAETYVYDYLGTEAPEGPSNPGNPENGDETTSQTPENNDKEEESESKPENNGGNGNASTGNGGGCGSVIGSGAIAIVFTTVAVCAFSFKKKDE